MLLVPDPFDPNFLDFGLDHEHRIYGDDYGHTFARVDADDYQFFSQWRWNVKYDKHGRKIYLCRSSWNAEAGSASISLYLHVEIHKRRGIVQPPHHSMVDHENGNTLECRKFNLRWATPSMNRRNINGQASLRI